MARSVTLTLTAVLALLTVVADADGYSETKKWWFFNTVSPNWTCADSRVSCYPNGPMASAFVGVYFVRRAGTLYVYAQGGGNPGPCRHVRLAGDTRPRGDNFCVFTTTDTAPGWTGQGLRLVNHFPRPDDGWFWQLRSAFLNPVTGRTQLIASRTASGATAQIDVMEAKLAESADGINFPTWTTLMTASRSQIGVRLEDYVLVPHPSQPTVWVGTLTWFTPEGMALIAPWKVDWNTRLIHLQDSSGVWRQVPVGGTLTFRPRAAQLGRVTAIQRVTVNGVPRLEAWGTALVSSQADADPSDNPCAPGYPNGNATSTYLQSRASDQQRGSSTVQFGVFDPDTLSFSTPFTSISSTVRALPSDYRFAVSYMAYRFDGDSRRYIYTGSKDTVICDYGLTFSPWGGSGLLVTKVEHIP